MNSILSSSHLNPFLLTSHGTKLNLIIGRTILERLLVQKDTRMESAFCCGVGVQTAINRTCITIFRALYEITYYSFLPQSNSCSNLRITLY